MRSTITISVNVVYIGHNLLANVSLVGLLCDFGISSLEKFRNLSANDVPSIDVSKLIGKITCARRLCDYYILGFRTAKELCPV